MKVFNLIVFAFFINSVLAQQVYRIGKNADTIIVDSDTRDFIVHVPKRYVAGTILPVVFMLHGTGGNGDRFHIASGWKELGDSLNIITVFPTSWTYCLITDDITGDTSTTTRWNDFGLDLCANMPQTKRDDIKFLNKLIDKLTMQLSIDTNRIYVVGFSNGGAMAGRCGVELSDRIAAVVEDAGILPIDTSFVPLRGLPVSFMVGNKDHRWLRHFPVKTLPMNLTQAKNIFSPFKGLINTHVASFGLDTNYTRVTTLGGKIVTEKYNSLNGNANCYFQFVYVQGLDHNYPNTKNHWLYGAALHWNWLKNFTLN